mmetsp:Transcript_32677/g.55448  ORF Transcript_32677/g.55448 Transcript_32677/m.55448 type:complete len:592 (+) Transcript_32677:75-1850(+)
MIFLSNYSKRSMYTCFKEEYILKKNYSIYFGSLIKLILFTNLESSFSMTSFIIYLVKWIVFHKIDLFRRTQFNFKKGSLAFIAKVRNLSEPGWYYLSNNTKIVVKFNKLLSLTKNSNLKYSIQVYKKKLSFFFRILNDIDKASKKPSEYYNCNFFLLTGLKGHGKKLFLSSLSKITNLTVISFSSINQMNCILSSSIIKLISFNARINQNRSTILYLDDSRVDLLKVLNFIKNNGFDKWALSLLKQKRIMIFVDIDFYSGLINYNTRFDVLSFSTLNLKKRLKFLHFIKYKDIDRLFVSAYHTFNNSFLQTSRITYDSKNLKNSLEKSYSAMNKCKNMTNICKNEKLTWNDSAEMRLLYFLLKKKLFSNLFICISSTAHTRDLKLQRYFNSLGVYTFEFKNKSAFYFKFVAYFSNKLSYPRPLQHLAYAIKDFNLKSIMEKSIFKNKKLLKNFFYFIHFLKILNVKYKIFLYLVSTDENALTERYMHNLNIGNIVMLLRKNQTTTKRITTHRFSNTEYCCFWYLKYLFKIKCLYNSSQRLDKNPMTLRINTILAELLVRNGVIMNIDKVRNTRIFYKYMIYFKYYMGLRYK